MSPNFWYAVVRVMTRLRLLKPYLLVINELLEKVGEK
jgi:hypothetical protein